MVFWLDGLMVFRSGRFSAPDGFPLRTVFRSGRFSAPDGFPLRTVFRSGRFSAPDGFPLGRFDGFLVGWFDGFLPKKGVASCKFESRDCSQAN